MYRKSSKKCLGLNDRINDSTLVTEHDTVVAAVNSSHVKFLHVTTHITLETSYIPLHSCIQSQEYKTQCGSEMMLFSCY